MEITDACEFLGQTVTLDINQPLGTKYPRHDFVYPINYDFVPEMLSPDGAEMNVYVLGVSVPLAASTGECIAVIHCTSDDDDKLIIVLAGQAYTDDEARAATFFQERFFKSLILRGEKSVQ